MDYPCHKTPRELLMPKEDWEGADQTPVPSISGDIGTKVNQLRDLYVFEGDGQLYLLYAGGGEQAIGMVKLAWIKQ